MYNKYVGSHYKALNLPDTPNMDNLHANDLNHNGVGSYYNRSQVDIPNIPVERKDNVAEGVLNNNQHTNIKGLKNRFNNRLSAEDNIRNMSKEFL